jgi:Ca-activated chloride channel homolog
MMWREPELFLWRWWSPSRAVLAYAAQRSRAAALRAFADERAGGALGAGCQRAPAGAAGLRVLPLAVLVIALGRAQIRLPLGGGAARGYRSHRRLDTSRSMLATDVVPNRLERAKLAVLDLMPRLQGDRIGLVAFAGTAFLEAPLTLDYTAFARSLRALQVGIIPRGGTSLSRAIETSLHAFEARQGKYEALILITDGEDHEGDALAAAEKAAERGVGVHGRNRHAGGRAGAAARRPAGRAERVTSRIARGRS